MDASRALRDDGRDVRCLPRGLGHLARDTRVLNLARGCGRKDQESSSRRPGLDGHDRGAKIIARALRDAGMEVIYTGLHQTPEQIVETAIQEDADAVGISILSGAHMTLVPRILDGACARNGAEDVLVVVGGTVPADDAAELKEQGRRLRCSARGRRRATSSISSRAGTGLEALAQLRSARH